ncbi:11345_t:CDS:2, partial [Acaulospora colombiana]
NAKNEQPRNQNTSQPTISGIETIREKKTNQKQSTWSKEVEEMITQDTHTDISTKGRNIQENEQSRDTSDTFIAARIDDSDVEMEEPGTSSRTRSESTYKNQSQTWYPHLEN